MTASTIQKSRKQSRWSETAKNYWLDIFLFVAFVIDMNTHFTGILIHEWLGIAFGISLVYHLMLHWKWIVSVSKRLFGRLSTIQRIRYLVDLALFINMVVVVITGLWISREATPMLNLDIDYFSELHHISANLVIWLVALHLALDWKWIVTNTKKYLLRRSGGKTS